MPLIVMKKAGEPGKIAINPDRVTHVRSGPGNFVDVYFGDVKVAVEGTFDEVTRRLGGAPEPQSANRDPVKDWYSTVRP